MIMKFIKKLIHNFKSNKIHNICEKYSITNYTINDDYSIDVDGYVNLYYEKLTKLPLKFRNVTGSFNCAKNKLTTLYGAPIYVGRDFNCCSNNLISLEGIPKKVINYIYCDDNQLKNLDYLPIYFKNIQIYGNPISEIFKLFHILMPDKYDEEDNSELWLSYDDENIYTIDKNILSDFIDREIIQNDIILIDRLVEFIEDNFENYDPNDKNFLINRFQSIYTIK